MSSLAVPVRSAPEGPVVAAISMVGPTTEWSATTRSTTSPCSEPAGEEADRGDRQGRVRPAPPPASPEATHCLGPPARLRRRTASGRPQPHPFPTFPTFQAPNQS